MLRNVFWDIFATLAQMVTILYLETSLANLYNLYFQLTGLQNLAHPTLRYFCTIVISNYYTTQYE